MARTAGAVLARDGLGIDLVIFDMDGVLVDSEPIANEVFREHLNGIGVPVTLAELMRDFVGLSLPSCYAIVRERYGIEVPEDFTAKLQAETFRRYRGRLKPVAGVPEMLPQIARPKCVASSSELHKIEFSLELTDLRACFGDRLFSAEQVPRGKPHPDLFLFAAEQMGADPRRTMVVEDSVPGVVAARAAGMSVLAYAGGAHADPAALERAGGRVFRDMRETGKLLAEASPGDV